MISTGFAIRRKNRAEAHAFCAAANVAIVATLHFTDCIVIIGPLAFLAPLNIDSGAAVFKPMLSSLNLRGLREERE